MIQVSLKDLFTSGAFGPIRLGASRSEVFALLGEPDDVGHRQKYDDPWTYKWGDFELHFDWKTEQLIGLNVHAFKDVPTAGKAVQLDPWIIRTGLPIAEFLDHLKRDGINSAITHARIVDDDTRMKVGAGVMVIFSGVDKGGGWPAGFHGLWWGD